MVGAFPNQANIPVEASFQGMLNLTQNVPLAYRPPNPTAATPPTPPDCFLRARAALTNAWWEAQNCRPSDWFWLNRLSEEMTVRAKALADMAAKLRGPIRIDER